MAAKDASVPLFTLRDYRPLGPSGLMVSPLCLGAMNFGEGFGIGEGREENVKIFDAYVGAGGNFIDTANMYGLGSSEVLLGELVKERGIRDDLVIATKYGLAMKNGVINSGGLHRKNLFAAVDASLKRLQTHYIDVMYLHIDDHTTPSREIVRAMDDLVRTGKVHYFAASDLPLWRLVEIQTMANENHLTPFIAGQYLYNLIDRTIEREITHYAAHRNIGLVPWGLLSSGRLTGKHRRGEPLGDTKRGAIVQNISPREFDIIEEVVKVSEEVGRSPSQVAINWVLQRQAIASPLIGARTVDQLNDNLKAMEFRLSPQHIQRLDDISKTDPGFPGSQIGYDRANGPRFLRPAGTAIVPRHYPLY